MGYQRHIKVSPRETGGVFSNQNKTNQLNAKRTIKHKLNQSKPIFNFVVPRSEVGVGEFAVGLVDGGVC
jgi:hypothetical protein